MQPYFHNDQGRPRTYSFNPSAPPSDPEPDPPLTSPSASNEFKRALGPTRVLIVDDDDWIRDVLARVLISHNYQVSTAASAEEALELIQYSDYDMVLSDMMLTGMSGMELTDRLHRSDPHLPIILITAHSDADVMRAALRHGACDFIPKPFTIETVPLIIERNLERQRLSRERTLFHEEEMRFATVQVLAASIDAKEPFTAEHSRRVARIAMTIATEIRLSDVEKQSLELAAQVHDVGKIGTPDYILNKPGRLSAEEWEIIKYHPIKGADIVGRVEQLAYVANVVRHHHEWINGTGYPDGIGGDEIPYLARVITVADAYEVMTSNRVYRTRLPNEEALSRLRQGAGTQFDTAIVEAFARTCAVQWPP